MPGAVSLIKYFLDKRGTTSLLFMGHRRTLINNKDFELLFPGNFECNLWES